MQNAVDRLNKHSVPGMRPSATIVVHATVEYVTDMTAAKSDTKARELKFGSCRRTQKIQQCRRFKVLYAT